MNERARIATYIVTSVLGLAWGEGGVAQTPPPPSAAVPAYTVFASGLDGPRGLLFGRSGELYVAEQNGDTVAKIGPNGDVLRIAKGFSSPHDLAIDR